MNQKLLRDVGAAVKKWLRETGDYALDENDLKILLSDVEEILNRNKGSTSSLGCDAANGGAHEPVKEGKYQFCRECGETLSAPTMRERARNAEARAEKAEKERDEARAALQWQLIKTPMDGPVEAPKDGSLVFAAENFHRASYSDSGEERLHEKQMACVRWSRKHGKWVSFGLLLESFEPTHWKPAIAPPDSPDGGTQNAADTDAIDGVTAAATVLLDRLDAWAKVHLHDNKGESGFRSDVCPAIKRLEEATDKARGNPGP